MARSPNGVLKLANRMHPACSLDNTRVAHTIVRGVTVGLQDAVEGSKKLLRAIPFAPCRKSNTIVPPGLPCRYKYRTAEAGKHYQAYLRQYRKTGG